MFLHGSFVYGPLKSRRLGNSLGVNLLPVKRKVCNFECIYCECGWTDRLMKDPLPSMTQLIEALELSLMQARRSSQTIDHITFAGNGEPTLHPDFEEIVENSLRLRDRYYPEARIAVLSNAVRTRHDRILNALRRVDDAILKMDAGTERMFQLIDLPDPGVTLDEITQNLKKFEGDLIVQTLFLRGAFNGQVVDNTTPAEIQAWIERLTIIRPRRVMIYAIDRRTPAEDLERIGAEILADIASQVNTAGFPAEYYP